MKEWKGFTKGVNLGGWMSQCDYSDDRLQNFIKEEDFAVIAGWGLDHVRLPIDYNVLENTDGTYKEEGFALVERAIGWAKQNGLNIVLDIHKTKGYSFDVGEKQEGFFEKEELQEHFYQLWEQLAKRFGHDPEHIAFELLNEVTDDKVSATWNRIADTCIARIRTIAPEVVILVGSYWNNHSSAVKALNPPYDDKVVYNFHSYDPIEFTHMGAGWVDTIDRSLRPRLAEVGTTEAYFEDLFAEAIAYAEKNGTVLYCGEYGVINNAQPEDVVAWYKLIHAVLERHHISRAAWSYRQMDFGLADPWLDGVRDELIKYL